MSEAAERWPETGRHRKVSKNWLPPLSPLESRSDVKGQKMKGDGCCLVLSLSRLLLGGGVCVWGYLIPVIGKYLRGLVSCLFSTMAYNFSIKCFPK